MTYKQKLCPLCGRDMTAIETHPGRGELYCGHCDLTIGGNDAKTPEELMALMDSSEHRRLQVENATLLEQIHWLKKGDILHVLTDQEYIDQCERERLMQVSIDALDKENDKLREELELWHRLTAGIELPEYPMTQFKPKDLERENAKLRELLHDFLSEHADYFAEGNYFIGDLDLEHAMHHNQAYFRREAKKLGVEVDE